MSDQESVEATETEAEATEQQTSEQETQEPARLPDDHPLVKTLSAQKEQIRELRGQIASRNEGEKTAEDRIAALERRAEEAERAALVSGLQAAYGITQEQAEGLSQVSNEDARKALAEGLAARSDDRKRNYVPREGSNPQSKDDPNREFLRRLVGQD